MRRYCILPFILILFVFTGCSEKHGDDISSLKKTGSMELKYATQFSVDYLENDISLVSIADGNKYLIIPENGTVPEDAGSDITVIYRSPEHVYLAASSAMDLFSELGLTDCVEFTSTKSSDWSLPEIRELVENDDIAYVGKYSAPDYEYLLEENCSIALESTMIYHTPEVMEKLEALGIPVMIERSSYESHPLGRMEWIKLYALMFGKEAEAERFFSEKCAVIENIQKDMNPENQKTVAFFSISSNGYINVRKPNDYISEMIRLAGGEYIFTAEDLKTDENALSTMNMQTETFYEKARNADVLIYNGTIDGGMESISQLTEKESVLSDLKAVKNGNVWCTEKNVFQKTTGSAEMISDINEVINDTEKDRLSFLFRLKQE